MSVVIGIDPHKALHAACAIDRAEVELSKLLVAPGLASCRSCWRGRAAAGVTFSHNSTKPETHKTASPPTQIWPVVSELM